MMRAADPAQQRLGWSDTGLVVAGAADAPVGVVAGGGRLAQVVAQRGEEQHRALVALQSIACGDRGGGVGDVKSMCPNIANFHLKYT